MPFKHKYLLICLFIAGFLLLTFFFHYFGIRFPGLQFVQELLLIPVLLAQVIVLIAGIFRYRKFREREVLAGILMLAVGAVLSLGSFFH
ncbi:hypothetical protein [Robiginitalea biformata]|uniref:Uncharacterized protein n=1 Tax=Robiginitalea biformata (strain ATCC BAA-864 / DSM 15991 / KCTC 12146 / HTCC2501) TaxID=313596 RepID=A4CJK5_ROBBH|nr:hypothetical protein [Robiginitalea biformata]EAR17113.1 hypothetical protein RB2501_09425 [Robiginitalea biformata HTCC2501]